MVATRRSAAAQRAPERSLLQLERDQIAAGMDMNWLPQGNRRDLNSRGIHNGGVLCYQSSVLQALLHQPPFLQFIWKHDCGVCRDEDCLKCFVKQLVEEYWGPNPTHQAIRSDDDPESIATISYEYTAGGRFIEGEQEDAHDFYMWMIEALSRNPPNRDWLPQLQTLYRINLQESDTCPCGYISQPPMETPTILEVGVLDTYTNIHQAIQDALHYDMLGRYCKRCKQYRNFRRDCEIVVAPKILIVKFRILMFRRKIRHTLPCPEDLDLTAHQQVPTLPLRYRLSSLVSHGGGHNGGHYIATVRGQEQGTYTCLSDHRRFNFTHAEFLQNPQGRGRRIPGHNHFEVYMLSYIRDDSVRAMPAAPGQTKAYKGRLRKELRNLM
ncbi:Nn.00g077050.m01.CDS01 [Neocucurbitaria sp. VM-36]